MCKYADVQMLMKRLHIFVLRNLQSLYRRFKRPRLNLSFYERPRSSAECF